MANIEDAVGKDVLVEDVLQVLGASLCGCLNLRFSAVFA